MIRRVLPIGTTVHASARRRCHRGQPPAPHATRERRTRALALCTKKGEDINSVTLLEGRAKALVRFPQSHPEPVELAWGPSADGTPGALYVLLGDGILLRLARGTTVFEELAVPAVRTIAADETGTMAFACFDDERWELDVYVLEDARAGRYARRTVEAPSFMGDVHLAVAGAATAVSFEDGPVWISRGADEPFRELVEGPAGGPVTFQGSASDAALFAVARTPKTDSIVRFEVGGAATCIGEMDRSDEPFVRISQLAWDASRSSLWAASGRAGILVTSPPGVPVPLGKDAAS